MDMSNIKIFVTHTPNKNDYMVDNPLLVDVIAGADYQTKPADPRMSRDNDGENISAKNKTYCELSTQYWAWKNIDADYYGFCHYRRFLTLLPVSEELKSKRDERGQISSPILNKYTVKKLGLDRSEEMEKFVEQYDCVLPVKQDLSKLPTPKGVKKSVYEHFAGHDRMFMHAEDLNTLMEVLAEKFPEYKEDAQQYLGHSEFWGFNCFILKKEWFEKLCEFEFGILFELEQRVDTRLYNRQKSRIYGFMGEILSCIFFYHLQKTHPELKFGESQLIYFENTEKEELLQPEKNSNIPVVFDIDRIPPYLFSVTIESFIKQINKNSVYEVIIAHHGVEKNFLNMFKEQMAVYGNVVVKFYDYLRAERTVKGLGAQIEDVRLLLPWILVHYDKVLFAKWNVWFKEETESLLNVDMGDCLVAGVKDVLMIGQALDISPQYEEYLEKDLGIASVYDLVDTSVMLMNLKAIREKYQMKQMLHKKLPKPCPTYREKINVLYQNNIKYLPQKYVYYYTENQEEKRVINQTPLTLNNAYAEAADEPVVMVYNSDTMWNQEGSVFCNDYWEVVRKLPYYQLFISRLWMREGECGNVGREPWVLKKVKGGIMCIEDHGLPYTLSYAVRKALKGRNGR